MPVRKLALGVLCLLATSAALGASTKAGDPATQSIMHAIFDPLARVLPLSLDHAAFRSLAHRPEITAALKELQDNASVLEQHAKGKERSFSYVARSLQHDAQHLYRMYTDGAYDEAEFTLHNMTDNCIACHAGLPETHKNPPPTAFFKAVKTETLHPLERAHLFVMSRQFDDALQTYEAYFTQGDVPASLLPSLGSFITYHKVCANVKQDLARPRRLLETVAQRPGIDRSVRDQVQRWSVALKALDQQGALAKGGLAEARAVVNAGREQMDFDRDRDGMIHYLVAGAILNRYVHSHPDQGKDAGEANYILGVTESLLGPSFWISRSDYYLESAIRLAPAAPFAPKAFALLEESYTVGFSGSGGTHIPDDVKELLQELRTLIAKAQEGKA